MEEQNSEDWLPTGWTVEVKFRKNGKRDKYYYESSSGHRFSSRAEVSRYLSTSSHEDEQKIKETLKRPSDDVVVEKTVAEGLPPGWTKEIRITKKARKTRRDTHYIAPASEKVFCSIRDVHRYLENEQPGTLTLEPSGSGDKESEDQKAFELDKPSLKLNETMKDGEILNYSCNREGPSLPEHTSDQSEVGTELGSLNPSEAKGLEQNEQDGDSTKSECISAPAGGDPPGSQCLESGLIKHERNRPGLCKSKNKKELILPRRASKRLAGVEVGPVPELKTSTRTRRVAIEQSGEGARHTTEGPSLPEHSSDQSEVGTESGSLNPPEAKGSDQTEQDSDSTNGECISVAAGGDLPGKQCLESGLIKHERKKTRLGLCKSKNKIELMLPRRASKRLAGVEVGPVPELKTSTRACRVAIKQSGEGVRHTTEGSSPGDLLSCASQHPDYLEVEPEKHIQNVERAINGDDKQRCASVFPSGSRSGPEEHAGKLETDYKAEDKPGLQPDLPLGDFFTDPCIAFAIETLTGIGFDNSRSNGEHASGDLATPKGHPGDVEADNKSSRKQESGNLFIPEDGWKVAKDDNARQKSGSPTELPFGGSWPDPCIEFAIKTLTGAIPVDYDPHIEEYFQQQLSSSKTQGTSDLTLKNVGLDNFCQTDDLCEQFCHPEVPMLKKQALSEPRLTKSGSLHSSGGSDVNQTGRQRH
ncbi:hypothetical protein ACFXTH_041933 [Malus domestica]